MTTEEKLLQEIAKRLDKIEKAISTGGGGLPVGAATETTLSSINTKVATETTLQSVATALSALKDGEFRVLSDPNDNDRLVGLTADMTNPAAPVYVYRYLDNNTPYTGNINDLEAGTVGSTNALTLYRPPVYYLAMDGILPNSPTVDTNITVGYNNGLNGVSVSDDGGAVASLGTLADFAALITGLNSFQTAFEFFELTPTQIAKTGKTVSLIGIRSRDNLIPNQWADIMGLSVDGIGLAPTLYRLSDETTTVDVILDRTETIKEASLASTGRLAALVGLVTAIYTFLNITLTGWFRPTKAIIDGAGRWRVSEPATIFNSKLIVDAAPLIWDDQLVSGSGGSSTHFPNKACVTLSVGAAACSRIRQTFMHFNYQSAKSQLIEITGKLSTTGGSADIETGFGYGNEKNGIFVKHVNGITYLGLRTFVSGVAVETWENSANWNEFAGINITPGYLQVLVIDFQWLGAGDVRVGFKIDDKIVYVHTFKNTNIRDTVFMSTPNLPIRYWITKTAGVAVDSIDCVCAAVIQEGGTEDIGILRYSEANTTPITCAVVGTTYILKAFKLKTTHFSMSVKIVNISITCNSNDNYEWELVRGGTVTNVGAAAPLNFIGETNGAIEVAQGATGGGAGNHTLAGDTKLAGGVVKASASSGDVTLGIPNSLLLGSNIAGTPDVFYLCVRPLTATADFHCSLTRREIF